MVAKEPVARKSVEREKQADRLDECSLLIACLKWQVDCGHDGWIKNFEQSEDTYGKTARGWENADLATRRLLQSITRKTSAETKQQPKRVVADEKADGHKKDNPTKDKRLDNRTNKQINSAATLAPTDAAAQAEEIALSCNSLEELERAVLSCTLCPLNISARNGVFAEGYHQADLMIVGEAPGKEEDEQGRPFVGASGQLLMRMLAHIDISTREQYYITNLVYWRPPGNRTPSPDELLVCHPFFKRQISLLRPRLLLLLGNVAAQTILREKNGITRLRGKFLEYNIDPTYEHRSSTAEAQPIRTLATFHPSYLLRTPAKKAATWHDLLMLRKAL